MADRDCQRVIGTEPIKQSTPKPADDPALSTHRFMKEYKKILMKTDTSTYHKAEISISHPALFSMSIPPSDRQIGAHIPTGDVGLESPTGYFHHRGGELIGSSWHVRPEMSLSEPWRSQEFRKIEIFGYGDLLFDFRIYIQEELKRLVRSL